MKIIAKTENGWLLDVHNKDISKFCAPAEINKIKERYEINEGNVFSSDKNIFLRGKKRKNK